VIIDSKIGTDTKAYIMSAPATGGYGEAVTVDNGDGYDVFLMANSVAPYGLRIVNSGPTSPPAGQTWGSQTDIRDSEIGTRDSALLGAGTALVFMGDNGPDWFNIVDTTSAGTHIGGLMSIDLYDSVRQFDSVQIIGLPGTVYIESLVIDGSAGDDNVYIENAEIESMVMIELHDGVDTLEIRTGVLLPGPLVGTILLHGGDGADFYHIDPAVPFVSFEILIP
jgi:hypothetical protein